ncbi:MAG: insulinase family protein [bacterium]|nr:insulinase family protein [bacterium]
MFFTRRAALAITLVACCFACYSGGDVGQGFEIPYVKYTLDNGLDVVLHEDHSDPIVAIATLVHVGSNREVPGKTGFAHFFEHMSFNDSENVPRGANRKMIGELGGTRNGGTWTDGTIYYEVVPKDAFEKLLWIDSDRLGFMINTVSEWALENEKQVVKNEKRQRVDNRPYGHTRTVIPSLLYPEDHPYNWPVIGSLEDLQAATLDDVREFYDRWYGANNATLVIAGDIDVEETRALVERWFGEIRRGPEVEPLPPMPVTLETTKSVFHEDTFAKLPEVRMVFPTVEEYHDDSYALDVLGLLLSDGKRAPLYRVIVEEQKLAPSAAAYQSASELAGNFTVQVRANADVDLDAVRSAIDTALERFEKDGFLDKDLARIKARQETDFYASVSSVLGKAFQLAAYNEYAADPGFVGEDVRRMQAVTREDVMDVYRRYVKDQHHVMTSFVPRGKPELAVEGAERAHVVEEKIVQGAEKKIAADPNFEYPRTETKHDRSEPALSATPVPRLPEIWSADASNGMRVQGIEHDELPLVQFELWIKGGHLLDPSEKSGAAILLADLMQEGTASKTPEELEDAIGELGASISVSAGREGVVLAADGLARHYDALLALVTEMLLEPRWDQSEFDRLKSAQLTGIRQSETDPQAVASRAFHRLLYGDDHIFSRPTEGTLQTVESISIDDLKTYYANNLSPSVTSFNVAGAVDRERVLGSLADLERRWKAKEVEFPSYPVAAAPEKPAAYFVDVPGSKQSVIMVGSLALDGRHEDFNDLQYANNRLGSGSSARLFQLLRIEKGYTYGAGSRVPRRGEIAPFQAVSSVRANVTLESLRLFREQLANYEATYTTQDLDTTKNLLTKQATRRFETLGSLMGVLENIWRFDLPLDFIERDRRELADLTLEDVHRTIRTYIDESRMVYVVVGDGETQKARVGDLGYGKAIELDVHGRPTRGS